MSQVLLELFPPTGTCAMGSGREAVVDAAGDGCGQRIMQQK
jgi:hypothetical protein